jgi:N-acetyl-anhydromuramyl-L-alanine amidase AmpD
MGTITINRQLRLTDDQYFKEHTDKTNICLHHTVGGSAKSTFDYWQSNPDRIATPYIVERDGTIYEVFDPSYWAHHLGLKMPKNIVYNQRTIGIELASEGALRSGHELNTRLGQEKFDTAYLYAFDIDTPPFAHAKRLYHIFNDGDKFFDCGINFRDYGFFDLYDEPQTVATIALVNHLCEQFNIPKQLVPFTDKLAFDTSILTNNWSGVYTHVNVRADKSDLSPAWDWDRLQTSFV